MAGHSVEESGAGLRVLAVSRAGTARQLSLLATAFLASVALLCVIASTSSAVMIGLNPSSPSYNEEEWEAVKRSGTNFYQLGINWKVVNQAGNWRQSAAWEQTYDKFFELAAKKEVSILSGFYGRGTEAAEHQYYLYESEKSLWLEYQEFVSYAVQRYGRGGSFWASHPSLPYRPVTVWGVWNEPNLKENNPGANEVLPQKYAEFLIATSGTIKGAQNAVRKAGEPNDTKVLHAGLYQWDKGMTVRTFLEKASKVPGLESSYISSFDGLSLHPYSLFGNHTEKLASLAVNLDNARNALNEFIGTNKPIWITELGWPVSGAGAPSVSEAEQASLLTDSFNWLKSKASYYHLELITWYFYRDLNIDNWAYHAGLRRIEDGIGSYRPAWYAFEEQTGAKKWPEPPTAETGGASEVKPKAATTSATINPIGSPTAVQFDYGKTTSYGASTSSISAGFGSTGVSKSQTITGLAPNTTYHYRVAATNDAGETTHGADRVFTTPPGTETFATVTQTLNGNPGWVTVGGNVYGNEGSVNGAYVNVNFEKWENGQWVYKNTVTPHPVISNNYYEAQNWQVGKGLWRTRTVLEPQGGLEESASGYHEFEIKDGYRLVARHSGKCLDVYSNETRNGAVLHQWECLNPATYQSQVYTLRPLGNATYELIARHSGRCVDVTNGSPSDGARLQQWDCNGFAQQKWQGVPYGPSGYSHFVAQHSGKCMDVAAADQNNGAAVNQWGCGAGTNQQWTLQSVESAPIPSHASLTVNSTLNGQPGFINVSGNVDAGGYSLGGQTVNVNFQREVSPNNWETVENETLHVNLNGENHYSWEVWGVGVGQWRTRVVYPGNAPMAESASEYHYFQIKSGYRLVSRYSGKCMSLSGNSGTNGTGIIQWDCNGNPSPGDGQVFTLVPMGGGYYEIKINSTGKCIDVTGGSTSDGAWLQEWDCLGSGQANQLWQNVELANQPGWFAFIAKHSGKCADVTGPSSNNGVRIQQWSCHWGSNQQWSFQAIN